MTRERLRQAREIIGRGRDLARTYLGAAGHGFYTNAVMFLAVDDEGSEAAMERLRPDRIEAPLKNPSGMCDICHGKEMTRFRGADHEKQEVIQ